jgi:hypothetical protein
LFLVWLFNAYCFYGLGFKVQGLGFRSFEVEGLGRWIHMYLKPACISSCHLAQFFSTQHGPFFLPQL